MSDKRPAPLSTDTLGWYLTMIGRVPLLTAEEEISLSQQVQAMLAAGDDADPAIARRGQRAKERMIAANLRLVVTIAKRHQNQGLDLLDLIQEGSIGLSRAVEKFDPAMGYKFSTYAYWWIRQGITRALDNHSRTIRLPIHVSERLSRIRKASRELTRQLKRTPTQREIAEWMEISVEDLQSILHQSQPCTSLDVHARGDDSCSLLMELIPDPKAIEPLENVDRMILHDKIVGLIVHLEDREQQVLKFRYGLDGYQPRTLSEIGKDLHISRERVRQVEQMALHKLRKLSTGRFHNFY